MADVCQGKQKRHSSGVKLQNTRINRKCAILTAEDMRRDRRPTTTFQFSMSAAGIAIRVREDGGIVPDCDFEGIEFMHP